MAKHVLFIGWNRPIPGREAKAAELFAETMNYYARMQKEGTIESFEPVLLARHGGDLNGFILVRGSREKLGAWMASPEFNEIAMRVDDAVSSFGIISGYTGEGVQEQMAVWKKLVVK